MNQINEEQVRLIDAWLDQQWLEKGLSEHSLDNYRRDLRQLALWLQEQEARKKIQMAKVLGTENPADLMTKYLTRAVMDTHLDFLSQRCESGRARSGLNIQGKTPTQTVGALLATSRYSADCESTASGDSDRTYLEDNWKNPLPVPTGSGPRSGWGKRSSRPPTALGSRFGILSGAAR